MEALEKRLAQAENQIRSLTATVADQAKTIKQLSAIIQPLTSKRGVTDLVKGALREIQRSG